MCVCDFSASMLRPPAACCHSMGAESPPLPDSPRASARCPTSECSHSTTLPALPVASATQSSPTFWISVPTASGFQHDEAGQSWSSASAVTYNTFRHMRSSERFDRHHEAHPRTRGASRQRAAWHGTGSGRRGCRAPPPPPPGARRRAHPPGRSGWRAARPRAVPCPACTSDAQ